MNIIIKGFVVIKLGFVVIKLLKLFTILNILVIISACSDKAPKLEPEKPASVIYKEAQVLKKAGDIKGAIKKLEELENQHPQSSYAKKALYEAILLAYNNLEYDITVSLTEKFITYNPNSKIIAQIYYIRALSYYEQIIDTSRDQSNTNKALQALNNIILTLMA